MLGIYLIEKWLYDLWIYEFKSASLVYRTGRTVRHESTDKKSKEVLRFVLFITNTNNKQTTNN